MHTSPHQRHFCFVLAVLRLCGAFYIFFSFAVAALTTLLTPSARMYIIRICMTVCLYLVVKLM